MADQPDMAETVRVFCASPGDVASEREAVKALIAEHAREWLGRGFAVVLEGWEDVAAAGGRAQGNINPLVDRATVFVGILSSRWGFATGDYTSGFEEEYLRALELYKTSTRPELCIFFKREAPYSDQRDQVDAFRKRLERSQEAYYRDYGDLDELSQLVKASIDAFLDRSHGERRRAEAEAAAAEAGTPEPEMQLASDTEDGTNLDDEPAAADWPAVLEQGAFVLLPDGARRRDEAVELADSKPLEAAAGLIGLADDVEAADPQLLPGAEQLRLQAAQLLHGTGDQEAATSLLLKVFQNDLRRRWQRIAQARVRNARWMAGSRS